MAEALPVRRSRSNSFKGNVMHERIRGKCDIVKVDKSPPGGDLAHGQDVGGFQTGTKRRLSCRPTGGRYKSTLTIRQIMEKKLEEIKAGGEMQYGLPSTSELEHFRLLVEKLDQVDPKAFYKFRTETSPEDVATLERMTTRLYLHFEGKEKGHARLSTAEFELKCTIDDVIVRLFGSDPLTELHPD